LTHGGILHQALGLIGSAARLCFTCHFLESYHPYLNDGSLGDATKRRREESGALALPFPIARKGKMQKWLLKNSWAIFYKALDQLIRYNEAMVLVDSHCHLDFPELAKSVMKS